MARSKDLCSQVARSRDGSLPEEPGDLGGHPDGIASSSGNAAGLGGTEYLSFNPWRRKPYLSSRMPLKAGYSCPLALTFG